VTNLLGNFIFLIIYYKYDVGKLIKIKKGEILMDNCMEFNTIDDALRYCVELEKLGAKYKLAGEKVYIINPGGFATLEQLKELAESF
jgi:hypothetical protein